MWMSKIDLEVDQASSKNTDTDVTKRVSSRLHLAKNTLEFTYI